MLARDVENSPARHDDGQSRCRVEQQQQRLARGHDVLEVVEHEQKLAVCRPTGNRSLHRLPLAFGDSKGMGDGRKHELRCVQGRELHKDDAVGEETVTIGGEGKSDARLPRAARPDQREQPDTGLLDQGTQVA